MGDALGTVFRLLVVFRSKDWSTTNGEHSDTAEVFVSIRTHSKALFRKKTIYEEMCSKFGPTICLSERYPGLFIVSFAAGRLGCTIWVPPMCERF